ESRAGRRVSWRGMSHRPRIRHEVAATAGTLEHHPHSSLDTERRNDMTRTKIAATLALTIGAAFISQPAAAQKAVPLFDDLGSHSYTISTENPQTQRYFNQGLRLYYGFNHAERSEEHTSELQSRENLV